MDDIELNEWLRGVFTATARGLGLPRWAEAAVNRALKLVPAEVLLSWAEKLGLAKGNEIRQLAQTVPDLPGWLSTPEAQAAVKEWEAKRGVGHFARLLRQAVSGICSFWRGGGRPSPAVCRGVAVIAASHFLPEAQDLRSQLAASIGGQESGVYLLRGYGDLVMRGETENVEHIDRMISEHPVVGEWAREFVAKGGEVGKPPRVIMCWEFQSSPVEKNGNGIRHWLFRRK